MRSNTPSSPARRTRRLADRRSRRRPAIVATALVLGILTTAGVGATAPASQAEALGAAPSFTLASYSAPAPTATAAAASTEPVTAADAALASAATTIAAASTITADIAASGLDIGVPDTTVDTAPLEAAVADLTRLSDAPAPLVPDTTTVTTLASAVDERVNGLRGSLDAAIALKAEQEAAEKARLEAEAAAAEAAAAAAKPAPARSSSAPAYAASGTSAGEAQATARGMIGSYGWGDDQFGCLVSLWNRESGWNYRAHNSSSGAHGIPQALPGSKMASAGADWETNPATQIAWGLGYISGRYGSPCGAWEHSESVGWY